jgi:hypothetical protein
LPLQVEALEDMIAREVSVSEELLGNLRGQLERWVVWCGGCSEAAQ